VSTAKLSRKRESGRRMGRICESMEGECKKS
jgi:hypothetical protein